MNHVLDASAVLAWILKEPGSERVRELMQHPAFDIKNTNKVYALVRAFCAANPRHFPFDAAQATEAGLLRPLTRHLGLSLGDRACLALARLRGAAVITTDRPWLQLAQPLGLSIECIRP